MVKLFRNFVFFASVICGVSLSAQHPGFMDLEPALGNVYGEIRGRVTLCDKGFTASFDAIDTFDKNITPLVEITGFVDASHYATVNIAVFDVKQGCVISNKTIQLSRDDFNAMSKELMELQTQLQAQYDAVWAQYGILPLVKALGKEVTCYKDKQRCTN